jgi:hypothetical protein
MEAITFTGMDLLLEIEVPEFERVFDTILCVFWGRGKAVGWSSGQWSVVGGQVKPRGGGCASADSQ